VIQAWAPTTPNAMACNSMALDRLDITRATPDDVGRVHVEKGLTGHPTGRLLGSVNNYYSGEPFTDDLYRRLPTLQPRAIGPGTERAMRAYNALGVTALYDGHAMDFRDDRRVPVAPCREPADRARLCCPEAQPYGLPWTAVPDDEQFAERLEQAAGMVQLPMTCCAWTASRSVGAGRAGQD